MAEVEAADGEEEWEGEVEPWPLLCWSKRVWTLDMNPGYHYDSGKGHLFVRFNGNSKGKFYTVPPPPLDAPIEEIQSALGNSIKTIVDDVRDKYIGHDRPMEDVHFALMIADGSRVNTVLVRPEEIVSVEVTLRLETLVLVRLVHGSGERVEMIVTPGTVENLQADWKRCRAKLCDAMLACVRAFGKKDGDNAIAKRIQSFFMYVKDV